MLALAEHRAGLCMHCGRPLTVCTDPSTEDGWAVPPPIRCFPTTALTLAQKPYQDQPTPNALLWQTGKKR